MNNFVSVVIWFVFPFTTLTTGPWNFRSFRLASLKKVFWFVQNEWNANRTRAASCWFADAVLTCSSRATLTLGRKVCKHCLNSSRKHPISSRYRLLVEEKYVFCVCQTAIPSVSVLHSAVEVTRSVCRQFFKHPSGLLVSAVCICQIISEGIYCVPLADVVLDFIRSGDIKDKLNR